MDVNTRQLRYFVAVAEELNFTRAAARLHIAQQALSTQIRQLEKAVGVTLFRRTTRTVELTSAGAAFLSEARSVPVTLDRSVRAARRIEANESGVLTIGTGEGGALTLTESILSEFRARHPGVQVDVKVYSYADPSAGLADGSVDVAYLRLPIDGGDWLRSETLFVEPRVVMLPASHRLAACSVIAAAELVDEPIVGHFCNDQAWIDFWSLAEHRDGKPANFVGRASSVLEELQCVGAGMGCVVTVASARLVPLVGVTLVPLAGARGSELAVGWRADQETDLIRSFAAVAHSVRDANPEAVYALEHPDMSDRMVPPVPGVIHNPSR
ncbi:LysR substrate-binding domain-containing protein [Microtetraspora sp. NBRC 16547]|uniref:LysR substrate-binding domain-containing protein n=1 Tax=Microtetraspora sp. NBRC 16547 TaxID=3030993 RepID=UPI0024A15083|nr:LysR substrate-binding domain-containing protein [Microtetraspora sp. NBRC 16547]GLX02118.1 LysR family transcriptional regulator [Microtetraspora sp. NBRC 16547]